MQLIGMLCLVIQISLNHFPDVFSGKVRPGRGRMCTIIRIDFQIRPALLIKPPILTDRRKQSINLFSDMPVSVIHLCLRFRLGFSCEC